MLIVTDMGHIALCPLRSCTFWSASMPPAPTRSVPGMVVGRGRY